LALRGEQFQVNAAAALLNVSSKPLDCR